MTAIIIKWAKAKKLRKGVVFVDSVEFNTWYSKYSISRSYTTKSLFYSVC